MKNVNIRGKDEYRVQIPRIDPAVKPKFRDWLEIPRSAESCGPYTSSWYRWSVTAPTITNQRCPGIAVSRGSGVGPIAAHSFQIIPYAARRVKRVGQHRHY